MGATASQLAAMTNRRTATNKGMRDITLTMDGVNAQQLRVEGDFLHIQSAPNGPVKIRANQGPQFTRYQSQGNRVYYEELEVFSSVAQTITLQIGYGYATDARATIAAPVFNVTFSPAVNNPSQADIACAGTAQTLLLAADANQIEAIISLPSNAAGPIRVGDATTAANKGFQIDPGTVVSISTTAAIYAYNLNAGAVTVTATHLRNV